MTITRLEDDTASKCQIHSNDSAIFQQHIMTDIVYTNAATVFCFKYQKSSLSLVYLIVQRVSANYC